MIPHDDILTPGEVERFTGLPAERYIAQRNLLQSQGIMCVVNAKKEVIVTWSWIRQAGETKAQIDTIRADGDGLPDFSSMRKKRA